MPPSLPRQSSTHHGQVLQVADVPSPPPPSRVFNPGLQLLPFFPPALPSFPSYRLLSRPSAPHLRPSSVPLCAACLPSASPVKRRHSNKYRKQPMRVAEDQQAGRQHRQHHCSSRSTFSGDALRKPHSSHSPPPTHLVLELLGVLRESWPLKGLGVVWHEGIPGRDGDPPWCPHT